MQGLVHVADQVSEQQQGLAAVAQAERRRRGPALKYLDGGLQRADHVVVAGASKAAGIVVALDRDIGEVILFVASDFAPARVALGRVATHEVDHFGDARGRLESLAGTVEARVGNIAPAVPVRPHILAAVGPCRRHLELHAEHAGHLAGRARVQQAVGHSSAELVSLGAERQHRLGVQQAGRHDEQAGRRTQSLTVLNGRAKDAMAD